MSLETVEVVSKIVLTGVASLVLGVMGWQIQWKQLGIQSDEFCFNHSEAIMQMTSQRASAGALDNQGIRNTLAKVYARRCDVPVSEAREVLNEELSVANIVESEVARTEEQIASSGYVAFGKIETDVPDETRNFKPATAHVEDNSYVPAQGDVLVAKWSVNLRANTTVTTGGENPATGIVLKGECVEVTAPPKNLRGQYWLQVTKLDACPDETVI